MGLWVFQKAQHVVEKFNTLSVQIKIRKPAYSPSFLRRRKADALSATPPASEAPTNAKLAASPVSGSLLCFLEAFVGEVGVVGVAGVSGFLV